MHDRIDRAAGFSLMEVLVAFVILSLSVTICLQVYASSARTEARAHQFELAFALLRERLASFETLGLHPGAAAQGVAPEALRWSVEVSEPEDALDSPSSGHSLVWITARVTDASGRTYSTTTARWLGEAFPEPAQ